MKRGLNKAEKQELTKRMEFIEIIKRGEYDIKDLNKEVERVRELKLKELGI